MIVFHTIDFSGIKTKILGDKMMSYLSKNEYNQFYENLSNDGIFTFDKFNDYQNNISEILGYMKKYRFHGAYKSKSDNEENNIIMEYDVSYSKLSNEDAKVNLIFKYSNNEWQVSQYKIKIDDANNDSEITRKINIINSTLNDENTEADDAKSIITEVMQAYDNENYKYVYTLLSNEMKQKGNEEEFVDFLKTQHDMYGEISNMKYKGYEISEDKSEYKLNYYMDGSKSEEKIYITFWVKDTDKLYLSGISFSENVW